MQDRVPWGFVGRQAELAAIVSAFDEGHQAVSIVGIGGIGKSALVRRYLEASGQGDGCLVAVGEHADPSDVVGQLASRLPGCDDVQTHEQLQAAVEGLDALVVLDGIEVCPAMLGIVRGWLRHTGLRVLLTSRRPVPLPGAQTIHLGPLPPEASRQLLVARASAANHRFDPEEGGPPLGALLDRLSGVPLAIGMASSKLRTLSASQLLARLDEGLGVLRPGAFGQAPDDPPMEVVLEACWQALDPIEQAVLVQCSVFEGSFSLDAADHVVGRDTDETLAHIDSLVAHGWLWVLEEQQEHRVCLVPLFRTFVRGRGSEAAYTEAEQRHTAYVTRRIASLVSPSGFQEALLTGAPRDAGPCDVADLFAVALRPSAPREARVAAALGVVVLDCDEGSGDRVGRALDGAERGLTATDGWLVARLCRARLRHARWGRLPGRATPGGRGGVQCDACAVCPGPGGIGHRRRLDGGRHRGGLRGGGGE
ncbi:MAG: hypothetical protein KTR31_22795 [Myxococcales bacterium]|nr:hypothetical protein [Myxococcales bacterium]